MDNDLEDIEDIDAVEAEDEDAESETFRRKSGKRLTESEFAQVKAMWELGTATLQEMSDQFGITIAALHRRLKRAGVERGSRAHEAAKGVEDTVQDTARKNTQRVTETKEQHYRYAEAIAQMTMQTIVQARKAGKAIATSDGDLSALNKAARTLEIVRRERYTVLGLDSDDGDPTETDELLISEMTDEQIAQLNQKSVDASANSDGVDALIESIEVTEEGIGEGDQ